MIVGLGPGAADAIPVGAVQALAAHPAVDVRGSAALRSTLAAFGVSHDPAAPVCAAPDSEALRLALEDPARELVPGREEIEARTAGAAVARLHAVTLQLRRDCPWDREQTIATIVPHTLEEAYEVADAALAGPPGAGLIDELGDLLFQVSFLATLVDEAGAGDLEAVATGIRAKLVRRHPHVFGAAVAGDAAAVRATWERVKRDQEGRVGVFHDVPAALPALLQARKLQRRASAVGFDWQRAEDAWPKLAEELAELAAALADSEVDRDHEPPPAVRDEAGDLLFAAVNVLRLAGVDPELALRGASQRFRDRVEAAERLAAAAGEDFRLLGLDGQEGYYRAAKATEQASRESG